jgi:phosphoserine aminotransferase
MTKKARRALKVARSYNFSAGPAMIPEAVLQQVKEEMLDSRNGMSPMEISHRSSDYAEINDQAERDLRKLHHIPDDYAVLFTPGGATTQFSMVPLNLLGDKHSANYIDTGIWSHKALTEARRYCHVHVAASSAATSYDHAPEIDQWDIDPQAAYLHYVPNETANGVEYFEVPTLKNGMLLVADMSSMILSKPITVSDFDLIYAGAQKNVGASGLSIVILRKELLNKAKPFTPAMYDYHNHALHSSIYNTPPTFAVYLVGLVLKWMLAQGGVDEMAKRSHERSQMLYNAIDNSELYFSWVNKAHRSRINIPFKLQREELTSLFIKEAGEAGLQNLEGHSAVGGIRANLYNAMPIDGVTALVSFMTDFARRHGF